MQQNIKIYGSQSFKYKFSKNNTSILSNKNCKMVLDKVFKQITWNFIHKIMDANELFCLTYEKKLMVKKALV